MMPLFKSKVYLSQSGVPLAMACLSSITIAVSFFTNSVLAKEIGPEAFGQYNFIHSVILLLGMSASFGLDTLSFSLFNQKQNTSLPTTHYFKFTFTFTIAFALLLSLLASISIHLFFEPPYFGVYTYSCLILGTLFNGLLLLSVAFLRVHGKVLVAHAYSNTAKIIVQGAFVFALLYVFRIYDFDWAVSSLVASFVLPVAVLFLLLLRKYPFDQQAGTVADCKKWLGNAFYVFTYEMSFNLYQYVDVFILEFLDKSEQMGIYLMARKISLFASLFTSLMGASSQNKMSKLAFNSSPNELQQYVKTQCRLTFAITVALAMAIYFISPFFFQWLGKDYSSSFDSLRILLFGEILNASFGNNSLFMPVSGLEKKGAWGVWVAILMLSVFVPFFWDIGGPIALSLTIVASTLLKNIISVAIIHKHSRVRFWIF